MGSVLSFFSPSPPQFQVFINFRGEELRAGFVGFLEQAMEREKVNVFIDEHELRGKKLTNLFTRIEESRIAITIFTKNYTESHWCLDELAKIKERMDQGSLRAIPIFYQMKIDDVKKLKGRFGNNFKSLKCSYHAKHKTIRKWEEALRSVPKNFGLSSSNYRFQKDLVKAIVEEVKKVLIDISHKDKIKETKSYNWRVISDEVIKNAAQCFAFFLLFTILLRPLPVWSSLYLLLFFESFKKSIQPL